MRAESSPLTVTSQPVADCIELTVAGVLDTTTYLTLRDVIIKAALEEPAAVVVDINGLNVSTPSAWAVFTSAQWHVGTWPAVPVFLVCGHADGRRAATRNGVARHVPVFATTATALGETLGRGAPYGRWRARADLPAAGASLVRSRTMVREHLTAWALTEFIPVANVIATVFIENVLHHTDSSPNLRLETDGTTVAVAVEDRSRRPPGLREEPGNSYHTSGLNIVAALARAWGNAPSSSGKTVWAVIGRENLL